ncbi:MAG: septal ring lytic transglycosylase RlpA family protein [Chakrabartia sp.]
MQLKHKNGFLIAASALVLTSCAGLGNIVGRSAPPELPAEPVGDAVTKGGQPYEVGGEVYNPADTAQYDDVGYASWYGEELRGKATANGEMFNPDAISAAHPTLPMPSYAEITHLQTGKTILVRINDRGPFTKGRLIDLSQGAVKLLGAENEGNFPVRVRRVNPNEQEKLALRNGQKAADRLDTPEQLLNALRRKLASATPPVITAPAVVTVPVAKPVQKPTPKPVVIAKPKISTPQPSTEKPAMAGTYFIQVASFSSKANAEKLAKQLDARVEQAGTIWRVRKGPYASEAAARAALGSITAKGYRDARVTR